jgi:hypothetical protein
MEVSFSVEARLLTALGKFTAASEMRFNLSCLWCEVGKNTLRLTATDGHRLAVVHLTKEESPYRPFYAVHVRRLKKGGGFLLPIHALKPVLAHAGSWPVQVVYDGEKIAVGEFGGLCMAVQEVQGVFPDYQLVVPRNNPQPTAALGVNVNYLHDYQDFVTVMGTLPGHDSPPLRVGQGRRARDQKLRGLALSFYGADKCIGIKHPFMPWFYGALMPMRLEDEKMGAPVWLLEPTKKAA